MLLIIRKCPPAPDTLHASSTLMSCDLFNHLSDQWQCAAVCCSFSVFFFFPVMTLISADEYKEETAQLHFSEAMFSVHHHHLPPLCELFNAIIRAASYLRSPAGCGRWKTEETKEQDRLIYSHQTQDSISFYI